ncbi:MAG: hypothetical protein M1444_00360 [Patescibacteria group bacterium]|nr:hypothetical protein [Patescibacteria group bacterium]
MGNKFLDGSIVYHESTKEKCVVIQTNADGEIKVRTEKDLERDYYPQELKTKEEKEEEDRKLYSQLPQEDKNWNI